MEFEAYVGGDDMDDTYEATQSAIKVRKRQTQSCDRCKQKKRRCDGNNPCGNCKKASVPCTMLVEQKKRGPKKHSGTSVATGEKFRESTAASSSSQSRRSGKNNESMDSQITQDEFSSGLLGSDNGSRIASSRGPINNNQSSSSADFGQFQQPSEGSDSSHYSPVTTVLSNITNSTHSPGSDTGIGGQLLIDDQFIGMYEQSQFQFAIPENRSDFSNGSNLSTLPNAYSRLAINEQTIPQGSRNVPNLAIADLPQAPEDFYLDLIKCFFTYFHKSHPVLDEKTFFEQLIPVNNHHAMLLCAIYSIGALYSRHPVIFMSPFISPGKANEYFANRASTLIPPSVGNQTRGFEQVESCQASLILSISEHGNTVTEREWMFTGMGCRLAQKLDMPFEETVDNFYSHMNGRSKPTVSCSRSERKRTWWGCLLIDFYNSLTTGSPFMINEAEYAATMMDTETLLTHDAENIDIPHKSVSERSLLILEDQSTKTLWKDVFNGFPAHTVFGENDTCKKLVRVTDDGYNLDHLFSNNEETVHYIQLNFLVRQIMRLHMSPPDKTSQPKDLLRLHNEMILWYERLPPVFRVFVSLESLASPVYDFHISNNASLSGRLSAICVITNLLFFCTFVLLHQKRALTPLGELETVFRLSSSPLLSQNAYSSLDICAYAYKAQCILLRHIYRSNNNYPVSPSGNIPSELVSTPIVANFLMPAAVTLLSSQRYSTLLVSDMPLSVTTEIISISSLFLPVIENISKIWARTSIYAAYLTKLVKVAKANAQWGDRNILINTPPSFDISTWTYPPSTGTPSSQSVASSNQFQAAEASEVSKAAAAVAQGALAAAQATMEAMRLHARIQEESGEAGDSSNPVGLQSEGDQLGDRLQRLLQNFQQTQLPAALMHQSETPNLLRLPMLEHVGSQQQQPRQQQHNQANEQQAQGPQWDGVGGHYGSGGGGRLLN